MRRHHAQRKAVSGRRDLALLLGISALVLCGVISYQSNAVWAKQDEHAVAPVSMREIGATKGRTYVGEASCLSCHKSFASQTATPMRVAAIDPAGHLSLDYSAMLYRDGAYKVDISKTANGLQMNATDGTTTKSLPIRWIFGQGNSGQTFVLEDNGKFYESRASYYTALNNLDLTIGHSRKQPTSATAALGRFLPADEVTKCFSCHTSENVFDGKLDVAKVHPGVSCENCHGAGSEHAANMAALHGRTTNQAADIFDPGGLPPADMNDFCGSCHRTTRDVLNSGVRDIRNIRFQPYRLENSRCYDPSDARITCVACHNPHQNLEKASLSYDNKCLACHAATSANAGHAKAAACPKATKNCVTCHMPKLELPGAHYAFTDHYIRIVHPGEAYPD